MRGFLAINLTESLISALADIQGKLMTCGADVRWVKPENIHLTLKFLGAVDEASVGKIIDTVTGTCDRHGPLRVELRGVGLFPHLRSPRVLWVGVEGGERLHALRDGLEEAFSSLGFERERRKFSPHLTLGRFRSSRGKDKLLKLTESLGGESFGFMQVREVSLMQSILGPSGAQYLEISRISLEEDRKNT